MFDPKQYKKLIGFCNKDDDFWPDLTDSGQAYMDTKRDRLMCMEDCDMHRGRGKPKDCKRSECEHYIFINHARKTLG